MKLLRLPRGKNIYRSCCKLSQIFGCGKTQISTVLRNKERIKELYESNASGDSCHTSQRIRESKYSEVNEDLYNGT